MNLIRNFYSLEKVLMKKNLKDKVISFSFQAKEKIITANATYEKDLYEGYIYKIDFFKEDKRAITIQEDYVKNFRESIQNYMKKQGFKDLSNPIQLELDLNKDKNQLNLDDIDSQEGNEDVKEANLKKLILKEYKGDHKKRLEEIIDEFFESPHNFYPDLSSYIRDNKGYTDQAHIDTEEIQSWKIILDGIFRENEVTDWETYEEDGFPDDTQYAELDPKELMEILSYPLN